MVSLVIWRKVWFGLKVRSDSLAPTKARVRCSSRGQAASRLEMWVTLEKRNCLSERQDWEYLNCIYIAHLNVLKWILETFECTFKLDVDPQRDDDASPMSTYRCMLRPTWMISALQHKSKYKSNSISNFSEEKNQIFWFPCCSTREDLSDDVSITYVGLILTKPGRFFFSAYGNSMYGQNSISSISNFLKNFHISGFPWCSTREDHSIDVSITNVGLILTKLRWFQLFVKSQNSNFELFWKKKKLGFRGVVLVKTFPLMYQLLM